MKPIERTPFSCVLIDEVKCIGWTRLMRAILFAFVHHQSMDENAIPRIDWYWQIIVIIILERRKIRREDDFFICRWIRIANESRAKWTPFVRTRDRPQATIFHRHIRHWNPETKKPHLRLGVQELSILMWRDLATDFRIFENVHGLWDDWVNESDRIDDILHFLTESDSSENWVEPMERMANFVE